MTNLRNKRTAKINRLAPQGPVKSRYDDAADIFLRGEFPNGYEPKPEPKSKRVLTEVEKEFWSGLTS